MGLIEIRGFREFDGELKTVTVSKEANQYHASLLFDERLERWCSFTVSLGGRVVNSLSI